MRRGVLRTTRTVLLAVGALIVIGAVVFAVSLTLPVETWRTGELPAPPLALAPGQPFAAKPIRLWIDSDAACGHGPRTDPDDCFAILLLAQSDKTEIVGISSVFGNASLDVTDRTLRTLRAELSNEVSVPAHVVRGASGRLAEGVAADANAAQQALQGALEDGPLNIIALGPLTNIAAALKGRPDLQANVVRLVAVMGRRQGHAFHPIEGGTARSWLGHGPIFRDFNFAQDPKAVRVVMAMRLQTTLIPYEAAREVMITDAVLDRMERRDRAARTIAQSAREWLAYWREDIGRTGFFPFDLMAAAYVIDPSLFRCADVTAAVAGDTGLFGVLGFEGLFVTAGGEPLSSDRVVGATVTYCPDTMKRLDEWLSERLALRPIR